VVVVRVTTTTTEPATKPAAKKSRQSKLEDLRRAVGFRERERDDLRLAIEETARSENEAVRNSLQESPRDRAYADGKRATKLKNDLVEQEKQLQHLEVELRELAPLLQEESDRDRQKRLGELRGRLFELGEAEELVWSQCGEVVSELLELWDSYREVVQTRDEILQTALHTGTLSADDGEARRELEDLCRGPIQPVNGSIDTFVLRLLDVCCDHDGLGCRDDGGRPADGNRRLPALLPDLRDKLRRLQVSGSTFEIR